ncbi:hypothetical protein [Streptomyces mesophilus]|uniref:hypothetical protein n=1 Tax=Streptomyces mesophilus TaxID=1775132 RepID=UPI003329BADF
MRLNRTLTALAVTVALSAGTVAVGAGTAFAAEGGTSASAPIDTEAERRVQRSLDKLYAAIDEAAKSGAEGTYDESHRTLLDTAVRELIAATEAVDPEPVAEAPAPAKVDPKEAVEDATKKLEAQVKVIVDAAAKGDLAKLTASVELSTNVVVDLLIKVGLGPILEKLGLGDVTKLLPGLTDLLLKPATPPAGLPTGAVPPLPLPLPLPVPGLPTGLPTGLPLGGLPTGALPLPFGK